LRFNAVREAGHLGDSSNNRIPVELQLADEPAISHKGHIESLDNRIDPQSGSIIVRAEFPNPDGRIVPGLFARIRLPVSGKHPALLIDETAIGTDQAQKFVLTITSTNTAAYRAVTLGPLVDSKRIVRSGLQPGEKIIVEGLAKARAGSPVVPLEATNSAPAGSTTTAQR